MDSADVTKFVAKQWERKTERESSRSGHFDCGDNRLVNCAASVYRY